MSKIERVFQKNTATLEVITPQNAERYLEMGGTNRRVAQANVDLFAKAMSEGRWRVDGATIRFSSEGKLLDGQHRLLACMKSGKSFSAYVVRDLDPHCFETIDTGRSRSAGDVLSIMGIPNYHLVAACCRMFAIVTKMKRVNEALENETAVRLLERYPNLMEWATYSRDKAFQPLIFSALVGGTGAAFENKHGAKAFEFWNGVRDGDKTGPNDPRWVLRERYIAEKKTVRSVDRWYKVAIAIKAWNAFLAGQKIHILKWLDSEDLPDIR